MKTKNNKKARVVFFNYKDYLKSSNWLIMKTKLVNRYLKRGWDICCFSCGGDESLAVHHKSYKRLFTHKEIDDLEFCCWQCHERIHKQKGFKEGIESRFWDEARDILDTMELDKKAINSPNK